MRWWQPRTAYGFILLSLLVSVAWVKGDEQANVLRAGAAKIDITPREFPVRVSGSFFEQFADKVQDPLRARCVVLDNGQERLAIVVVDNCVIPRDLFDQAKSIASEATGIRTDRMLMSATHTHSGPALDGLLGSDGNPQYRQWLPGRIAQAVEEAAKNLVPAKIGWVVVQVAEQTHCRRWIRRPDKIDTDPFGYASVRAMMHPGWQNPDYVGPSGPADPDLSIVSVQSRDGKPIALLANYAMHYYGAVPLSADYFGVFAEKIGELLGADNDDPPFVGMMSNGTSGDLHWMDYSQPKPTDQRSHVQYGELMARTAFEACQQIVYHDWVPFTMRERTLSLKIRPIGDEEFAKARERAAAFEGRKPKTLPEVYAWEQVALSQKPSVHELKLQAVNIGGLGIAAIPCEVFGITGLKIKAQSPLIPTFTIELANGYEGYVPPPAQHALGGYTTWRALSACLEVDAEPKITAAVLELLAEVAGQPRRTLTGEDYPLNDYPRVVLASKPIAYWRLNEFEGPLAADTSGNGFAATFEPGVAFYLEGPPAQNVADQKRINRAPHFAGGRIRADLKGLGERYTVEMWFNNYLPVDARQVTGYLFSRGTGEPAASPGDHLGIGGTATGPGKLLFCTGDAARQPLLGHTEIPVKTWNHVAMVRDGDQVVAYLNGDAVSELSGQLGNGAASGTEVFIGGRNDGVASFEGRIDEVAIYSRVLPADEVSGHYRAGAGKQTPGR